MNLNPISREPYYSDTAVTLFHGDCIEVMRGLPDASVDSVVTDPPYGLEFMGKDWDAPWKETGINRDAGFKGGGLDATKNLPSFTSSTNPNCSNCGGKRRGRRDGTALVAVCVCDDPSFPNTRATEMRAFQEWCEQWARECLRVLRPGGHMLAFGGSRSWHRLAAAVEDAGFEIRDSIAWLYGSGFPKSLDVSKAIDAAAGAARKVVGRDPNWRANVHSEATYSGGQNRPEFITAPATDAARQWEGWGTALKPAFEPIVVGRKPLSGTVASNVLAHGTGALNIDATRTATEEDLNGGAYAKAGARNVSGSLNPSGMNAAGATVGKDFEQPAGRWPTNVVLDESQAAELDKQTGTLTSGKLEAHHARAPKDAGILGAYGSAEGARGYGDSGGASRFFPVMPTFRYEAKAPTDERPNVDGVQHPTVKPLDLMRWLVRLVTPPGGTVLEPFAGSGTTVEAALLEGFSCIGIEREATYLPLITSRIKKPLQQSLFGDWDEAS